MRAYGLDPRRDASGGRRDQLPPTPWLPPMESGGGGAGGVGNLTDRFFRLGLGAVPNGNLHQVMMAVEGAENTIKKQVCWPCFLIPQELFYKSWFNHTVERLGYLCLSIS